MTTETPMITITMAEYDRLVKDSEWLECLEAAGVDNWDGWDEARRFQREMNDLSET